MTDKASEMNEVGGALATLDQSQFMPAMSIELAVERYNTITEFVSRVLRKDVDYGVIPGTEKLTLLKPGAEKLVLDTLIDDVRNEIFNPWDMQAYAHMLEEMLKPWNIRTQEILENPNQPLSFLLDEENKFKVLQSYQK